MRSAERRAAPQDSATGHRDGFSTVPAYDPSRWLDRSPSTAGASSSPAMNRSSVRCSTLPRSRPTTVAGRDEPIRVVVVPTAAARHNPDAASRFGTSAFQRVADGGRPVQIETARVVDAVSAEDPVTVSRLSDADLIYLPGGDPDVIPTLLPASGAWRAMDAARRRGAVLAGASAGAMGLCQLTWTPTGIRTGLGVVRGLVVFPHADAESWARRTAWFDMAATARVGVLGIGERTGVISPAYPDAQR